jgi:hypothetical protein
MDETKAKSNLCEIFQRREDGQKLMFGCGCLVNCTESLKIATSGKIQNLTNGKVFAKFEATQDQEIELQIEAENLGSDSEIAYISLNENLFEQGPKGIPKADDVRNIDEVVCRVPVFENLQQFGDKNEIKLYDVVKDHSKCSLEFHSGNNTRVVEDLRQSERYLLLVCGAPILNEQYEFLGIVDFLEVDKELSLLQLNYHDGIHRTTEGL